jgi:pyruvate,water dikinase
VIRRIKEILGRLVPRREEPISFFQVFEHFQELLQDHQNAMEIIADLGEKSGGDFIFDRKYLEDAVQTLQHRLLRMVKGLNFISADGYLGLYSALDRIFLPIEAELRGRLSISDAPYVTPLKEAPLDVPELIGGKAATLAEIISRLHLPVPDGFVITTRAYRRFLEYNDLEGRIHKSLESWASGEDDIRKASSQIRYSILAGVVPQDLASEIKSHAEKFSGTFAVRSSAYGEDSELSFAGLHDSFLNVPPHQLLEEYKKVLASLYASEALAYRLRMGMLGEEAAMAVVCLQMVPARSSGVIHTISPTENQTDYLEVYSTFGLGRTVVEGRGAVDRFVVGKESPHPVVSQEIARKEFLVRSTASGGEERIAIDPDRQMAPSLSQETLAELVKMGMSLERYFKRPQEIEWAEDDNGTCYLLQSRRLVVDSNAACEDKDLCESCSLYPILVKDKGVVAHGGVGSGRVCLVESDEDMARFPEGSVLLIRYTAPWLAQVVPKASAIVAERGSAAGHLATIAREFRVPTLVGVDNATDVLKNGLEVTLDTHNRIIYEGHVRELLDYALVHCMAFEDAPEFRLLRRLLRRTAPLYLVDPHSPDFSPEGCKTVHDLIRFIHEKAVQELMDLPTFVKRFRDAKVWTLSSDVPMDLKILDIGEGIDAEAAGDSVTIEQVRSIPLLSIWSGIAEPGAWSTAPVAVDLKGFMSSLTRNWADMGSTAVSGFNLAVVGKNYMNLHLRLGYHFNLVDARMDDEPQHNHIYFRFVGGVTDLTRRSRRAQVLARILSQHHFKVSIKGDLVVAGILHLPREEIGRCLHVLGTLVGFTRQLDMQLRSEQDVGRFVDTYFDQYGRTVEAPPRGGEHNEWRETESPGLG